MSRNLRILQGGWIENRTVAGNGMDPDPAHRFLVLKVNMPGPHSIRFSRASFSMRNFHRVMRFGRGIPAKQVAACGAQPGVLSRQ